MADPFSITGLILQVSLTLKQLYDYAKTVKSSRADIKQLCLELSTLRSLLEDFRTQTQPSNVSTPSELLEYLQDVQHTLNDLHSELKPAGTAMGRAKQALQWPFKEGEAAKVLDKLGRAKSMLMLYLLGDIQSFREDLAEIKSGVNDVLINQEDVRQTEYRRRALDWIAPVSPNFPHKRACAAWQGSESGMWFVNGALKHCSGQRLIALVGASGAGKTTLFSRAVEYLATNDDTTGRIAYTYCMYNDARTQEIENILGSWISQLWSWKPEVLESFEHQVTAREVIPLDMLLAALSDIAESAGQITLAIDAINECKDVSRTASVLSELVNGSSAIQLLLSTTNTDSALANLVQYCKQHPHRQVVLTPERMKPDIEAYIDREIAKHEVLRRMPKHEIALPVLEAANGMFRWASCQMSVLAEQATPKKVRQALGKLPATLNDTYVASLQRVGDPSKEIVREVLVWLSLSQRPMTLQELVEAVAFEPEDGPVDDDCRIYPATKLIEMCEGLVVLDTATQLVSLAHGSIRSFLQSDFIRMSAPAFFAIDEAVSLGALVVKCLSYLLLKQFDLGLCFQEKMNDMKRQCPLLDYASKFWTAHAVAQQHLPPDQVDLIDRLFWTKRESDGGGNFTFWIQCMVPEATDDVVTTAEPLYYASSFGLTQVVTAMLQDGRVSFTDQQPWYIDYKCGRAVSTALQVACWRGHTEIVSLLIDAGADPSSTNIIGATCLYCARQQGHVDIERRLMAVGAIDACHLPEPPSELTRTAFRTIIGQQLLRMGISPVRISDSTELHTFGIDSLAAMDICSRLVRETGLDVSPMLLLYCSIREVEDDVLDPSTAIKVHVEAEGAEEG